MLDDPAQLWADVRVVSTFTMDEAKDDVHRCIQYLFDLMIFSTYNRFIVM